MTIFNLSVIWYIFYCMYIPFIDHLPFLEVHLIIQRLSCWRACLELPTHFVFLSLSCPSFLNFLLLSAFCLLFLSYCVPPSLPPLSLPPHRPSLLNFSFPLVRSLAPAFLLSSSTFPPSFPPSDTLPFLPSSLGSSTLPSFLLPALGRRNQRWARRWCVRSADRPVGRLPVPDTGLRAANPPATHTRTLIACRLALWVKRTNYGNLFEHLEFF